jgi:hypothetical protein
VRSLGGAAAAVLQPAAFGVGLVEGLAVAFGADLVRSLGGGAAAELPLGGGGFVERLGSELAGVGLVEGLGRRGVNSATVAIAAAELLLGGAGGAFVERSRSARTWCARSAAARRPSCRSAAAARWGHRERSASAGASLARQLPSDVSASCTPWHRSRNCSAVSLMVVAVVMVALSGASRSRLHASRWRPPGGGRGDQRGEDFELGAQRRALGGSGASQAST